MKREPQGNIPLPFPLHYRGRSLCIEGSPLQEIAERVGTPAYVYSEGAMRAAFLALERAFHGLPHMIFYALKANPNLAVCRLFARLGAGAEIVSGGELERAKRAGFRRILFSGVGKTAEEIREALRAGVLLFNAESEEEIEVLNGEARRLRRRAPVSIRVNPDVDPGTHRHITTGKAENKFGLPMKRALPCYLRAARLRGIELLGIHAHIGSQITRVQPYVNSLKRLLTLADALSLRGIPLRFLDIGGGMGVRYRDETPLDPVRLARGVKACLGGRPLTLLLEPGRFLTASSGALLSRVLYRKTGERRRFVVLDAGMNDLLRPALYGARHPIVAVRRSGAPLRVVDVVGPVCETSDTFARGARLPWPERGEVWAILMAGAYGFSMSSQYNSRPRPPEVLVSARGFRVVRRRESRRELLRLET